MSVQSDSFLGDLYSLTLEATIKNEFHGLVTIKNMVQQKQTVSIPFSDKVFPLWWLSIYLFSMRAIA